MRTKKTSEDGWNCVPELKDATSLLGEIQHEIYEVDHCVRVTKLEDLVSEMISKLEEVVEILKEIDTDVEYVTIFDDDE